MKKSWKPSKGLIKKGLRNLEFSYRVEHRDVKYPRLEFESNDKLLVILPYNIHNEEELLTKKEDWILKKLKIIDHHLEKFKEYEKGNKNKKLIFGKFYDVVYSKGKYNVRVDKSKIEISAPSKNLALRHLKNWLKEELKKKLLFYLDKFSNELSIKYNKVFIRTQKTKWASCSSKGNLSFNIKIAFLPEELIEYAVLHEAVHLKEDKHNKNFWKIIKEHFPDYKEKESLLAGFWFLINRNNLWMRSI